MSETKTAVFLRGAAVAMGIFVVLVGAANVTARLARMTFGDSAAFTAFAPAITLFNPVLSSTTLAGQSPLGGAATSTAVTPVRLVIPSIGVDAPVEQVGKKADGTMGTPQNFTDVAWYALGPKPGEPGDAVIDGHVNNARTTAGVFEHLGELKPGDAVMVAGQDGRTLTYTVKSVQEYAPDASIFTASGPSQLVLITCDGDWVPAEHQFNERLAVVAQL